MARHRRSGWLWPVVVIISGLSLSLIAAVASDADRRQDRNRSFRSASELARSQVQERLTAMEDAAAATSTSLMLVQPLDRPEFRRVTGLAHRLETLASLSVIGVARTIRTEEIPAFEATVRADDSTTVEGFPDFAVNPVDRDHDVHYVIEFLSPLPGNEGAFGFDLGSDPPRRKAVEDARDRGEGVASPPIDLVQSGARAFLMMHPLYDTGDIPSTAPSRRRHFVGVQSSVVRIEDLLVDVLGPSPDLDMAIYDIGETVAPAAEPLTDAGLLFRSAGVGQIDDGAVEGIHGLLDLDVGGRRWRLVLVPAATFPMASSMVPIGIGAAGAVITLLLGGLVAATTRSRQRAEDLVAHRTADLRELVLNAPDATLVVDPDGLIVLASLQVDSVLGHRPEDLVGTSVDLLVPASARGAHPDRRNRFSANASVRSMAASGELRALRADGTEVPVEVSLAPLQDGNVIASVRDVSLQTEARRELQRSNDQKTTFLGTVSHELRTPLTAIRGFVRLLLDRGEDIPATQRHEFLERVARNTDSLAQLIDELLEFSRLERDALSTDLVPDDLADAVATILDQLETGERPAVQRSLAATPCLLDRRALTRIITNLVDNAHRYGGGTPITVSVAPTGAGPQLVVEDHGPGIAPADRGQVFDRFWRGESAASAAVPGTGIGLAVVAELTELLGGTVTVAEVEGGGARFVLTLPSATAAEADDVAAAGRAHV